MPYPQRTSNLFRYHIEISIFAALHLQVWKRYQLIPLICDKSVTIQNLAFFELLV